MRSCTFVFLLTVTALGLSGCKPSAPSGNSGNSPKDTNSSTSSRESAQAAGAAEALSSSAPNNAAESTKTNASDSAAVMTKVAGNDKATSSSMPSESSSKTALSDKSNNASIEKEEKHRSPDLGTRMPGKVPDGKWTTQRLIAITDRGPVVIDLKLQVGELDLNAASEKAFDSIAQDLLRQLEKPATWPALIELPLVKSGWLGNIVPNEGQVDQLISMYDKNQDKEVQADELVAFLTRGLSRSPTLAVTDAGTEMISEPNNSPFGPLDINSDNALDADEQSSISEVLSKFDFDSDSTVALLELSPSEPSTPAMMNGRRSTNMLKVSSLVYEPPLVTAEDATNRKKSLQRKVVELMEHYSFLGEIERAQWPAWNDVWWKSIDKNNDEKLGRAELSTIFDVAPMVQIAIRFATPDQVGVQPKWFLECSDASAAWGESSNAGHLKLSNCDLGITIEESYSEYTRNVLRTQLGESFNNATIKQFLMQQLQLKDSALELADSNGDMKLSDEEFSVVWGWLTARQAARFQARWMLAARPWFQILDRDFNQSLSPVELKDATKAFAELSGDGDLELSTGELPVAIRLQVSRTDSRLNLPIPPTVPGTPSVSGDSDWFSAMDTNRDGSISRSEFLGSADDFRGSDRNGDGFISKSEVY